MMKRGTSESRIMISHTLLSLPDRIGQSITDSKLLIAYGLLRPSFFIRDRSVLEGIPRVEAALFSPPIRQLLAFKTRRI